jgi:hypothetical protein
VFLWFFIANSARVIEEIGGSLPYTISYSAFDETQGVRVPMVRSIKNNMTGETMVTFDSVRVVGNAPDSMFELDPMGRRAAWVAGE